MITDRTKEFLAGSDRGIIMLRKMLLDSIDAIESGADPFAVLRNPADNVMITFDAQKNFADTDRDFSGKQVTSERTLV